MIKFLQSQIAASIVGAILFCVIVALAWTPPTPEPEPAEVTAAAAKKYQVVLDQINPEMQQVMEELHQKKAALETREAQLRELEVRLQSEREEMDVVTQAVARIQKQFDESILKVRESETANLKRLAKTCLGMSPEGVSKMFRTMNDDTVAKILRTMKEADSAPIIDVMALEGPDAARRTARIVERMHVAMNESNAPPSAENLALPAAPAAPAAAPATPAVSPASAAPPAAKSQ